MSIERYSIFRMSLLWFIWAISVFHMVWFSGPFHALRCCSSGSAGSCLLRSSLGSFAAVQQLSAVVAARGPCVEGKAAAVSPDAANAAQTGGGDGEGGVDQGFVLQASDNDEIMMVEPAATGTGWPGA